MRWQALFADLEAQLDEAESAELRAEVAEASRLERGRLRVLDRLVPAMGCPLTAVVLGVGGVQGRLVDAGSDWLLLAEPGAETLVPVAAVLSVTGVGLRASAPGTEGEVGRRLDFRWVLRGLSRSRSAVQVRLRDGYSVSGTLDHVGADHVDLAEHPQGEPRRPGEVTQVRLVPLTAIALVRSS